MGENNRILMFVDGREISFGGKWIDGKLRICESASINIPVLKGMSYLTFLLEPTNGGKKYTTKMDGYIYRGTFQTDDKDISVEKLKKSFEILVNLVYEREAHPNLKKVKAFNLCCNITSGSEMFSEYLEKNELLLHRKF